MRSSQGVGGNEAVIWLLADAGPEVFDWWMRESERAGLWEPAGLGLAVQLEAGAGPDFTGR